MFGDNVSFENRTRFSYNNVMDIPDGLEETCGQEVALGLTNLRSLLLAIYSDVKSYKANDALESYHNLLNMVYFLYTQLLL